MLAKEWSAGFVDFDFGCIYLIRCLDLAVGHWCHLVHFSCIVFPLDGSTSTLYVKPIIVVAYICRN